jgi:hypothetical protein
MVQAVCLPLGSKMLVIPIFLPMIPFICFAVFSPQGCARQTHWYSWVFNPGLSSDLFPNRSIKSGEVPATNKPRRACLYVIADWRILTYSLISSSLQFLYSALFSPAGAGLRDE